VSADEAVDFFDEVGGGLEGAATDARWVMRAKKRSTWLSQEEYVGVK
jgi:hypothetical protein